MIRRWSRHSRRSVPMKRSAIAFARGARIGVRMMWMSAPAKTASNAAVNLLSRSRIKNRNRSARSAQFVRGRGFGAAKDGDLVSQHEQFDTTPEEIAELATNMLCQFEELREFAAGLVAGWGPSERQRRD